MNENPERHENLEAVKAQEQLQQEELLRKKSRENQKYVKIGFMIFVTFVCCILFFFIILRYQGFAESWSKIVTAAQPIIMGLVIAYLLNPVMKFWELKIYRALSSHVSEEKKARKIARVSGVTCSIVFFFAIVALLIAAIVPATISSVSTLVDSYDENMAQFTEWLDGIMKNNPKLADTVNSGIEQASILLEKFVEETLKPQTQTYIAEITTGVISVAKVMFNFLIGIFVAVYVMMIQETLTGQSKKILYTIFQPKRANVIIETLRKSSDIFGGFITGKLIDSAIIGLIAYVGCMIMRIPDSILVAVIIGVTNIIPFFGPLIGAVPTLLLVVIQSPIHALYLLIFIVILQQVDGNIIGPKILGDSTGLSSFWIMFSILVFGGMFGFPGMVLGVPVFAVIYYVTRRLVCYGLSKRGLPTETSKYIHVTRIDNETKEMVYEEKVKEAPAKKDEDEDIPGDTLKKHFVAKKIMEHKKK